MSILDYQADRLRKYAERLRQLANGHVNQGFPARQDLYESAAEMREAADTIEELSAKLQGVMGTRYNELFGTPERAARTMVDMCEGGTFDDCGGCPAALAECKLGDYDALLEWLRGDA